MAEMALAQGVGDNALLWVDGPDGKPALLYVIDRRHFSDAQLEQLRVEAQQWVATLNPSAGALRII